MSMEETMQRQCKACDGRGDTLAGIGWDGRGEAVFIERHPCLACSGTGQVEERIPAADAIADAETLLSYAEPEAKNSSAAGRTEINLGVAGWYSRTARYFALLARTAPAHAFGYEDCGSSVISTVAANAVRAARAAFRAVPGLRGE